MNANTKPGRDAYVAAVDALGDAWTFLITREAFFGAVRFQDFCERLNVPRARLAERLKHLVANEIFERRQYSDAPVRFEYHLTARGVATYSIALTMIAWGENWRSEPGASGLVHQPCGERLRSRTVCRECGRVPQPWDLVWPPFPAIKKPATPSVRGWRKMASFDNVSDRRDPAIDMLRSVGDRWSMLIVYGALRTTFRFRDAKSTLGVSDTILSDRLKHLVTEGILETASGGAPYQATEAGMAMLDPVLAMRSWALDWAPTSDQPWAEVIHQPCGSDLRTVCVCSHCEAEINPSEVLYETDPGSNGRSAVQS